MSFKQAIFKNKTWLGMMAQTFNPNAQEAVAGRQLSFRPDWSIDRVLGWPGPHTHKTKQQQNT